ncbi:hypothetical protein DQ238_08990 [Geodermatophilus sp. TF02-6]|uniref:hypothetical protein n=1 Tax=Geodermatophilus sp. TF02-6 TaxID=2250575 RepID=UPI000DEA76B2|nr:hypothetical protein [Geodermatophilus sp. TF02-6]RBY79774.1 hypothetical protein DQ238_08990 [Geodermatophilus sp. TF02-6]
MVTAVDGDVLAPSLGDDHRRYLLAAGTELIGEYQDSGLHEPKYLVRRADDQVMQLSRLLYRVAGSLDGRATGQIAADLSAELGRELTGDDVSFLVEERLRPVGIIAAGDADADDPEEAEPSVRSDPLLALRYRVGVLPAVVSWRVAGVFRPFFLRPVWVTALAGFVAVLVAIAARGDLLGQALAGVEQLVHAPELLLLIYVLTIAAGTFHECGHVTACRYGGARPGDMGVGLYIVWPAFYSTVTDSYRLSRIGRLRTDLGGVYFNAVFMIGLGLLYLYTGQPWLLIALFGMLGETLRQFIPAIRLDGYYILADLVGVPELFGYVWPALSTVLPGRPTHPKVRELRPWARRVIVGWVALVVPTLLVYFIAFLVLLPHVLPVVWRAFLGYLGTLDTALRTGDVVTSAVGVFQLFLLVLPWVGAVLMAGLIGGQLRQLAAVRWGWQWAAPAAWTTVRRVAALGIVGGLAGALVWRVGAVAASAPPSTAEARITASAFAVLHGGRDAAPPVAPGERAVRDQLVGYARATGAFDRHESVLLGGRELAVVSCVVLVACFLLVARVVRWRLSAVALPLAAATAMGPAVLALARTSPAGVAAAWAAGGATLLVLAGGTSRGRHRRGPSRARRCCLVGAGVGALLVGVWTAPLAAVPLALGTVLVVAVEGRRPHPFLLWTALVVAAFGATQLAALTAPALLDVPTRALSGPEREVVALVAGLLVVGALAVRGLTEAAAAGSSLVALTVLPTPGADSVLPLVVVTAVVLGALVTHAVTREPVGSRPHPLVRAALAVPVLVLVVVGALFLPARAPDPAHRELAAWVTDPASPARTLTVPVTVWADLVRDGVPTDRLRLGEGEAQPVGRGWTVTAGVPAPGPGARVVFGSGPAALTVLGPE